MVTIKNKSIFTKGHIPWNKGLHVRLNPSGEFKKRTHSSPNTEFKKGHKLRQGRKHSFETRTKISIANKGKIAWNKGKKYLAFTKEKNVNWKGGITSLMETIRHSFEYRLWRSDVFKRDKYMCQKCFKQKCYLEVHHRIPINKIISKYNIQCIEDALLCQELWNINTGITLCSHCHIDVDIHRQRFVGGNVP